MRGPNHERIPEDERVAEPLYAHTHEEVDRDCDSWAKAPRACPVEIAERRARLHGELEEDAAAVQAADDKLDVVREVENDAMHRADEALAAVFATPPTTVAGLLAAMDLFEARERDNIGAPVDVFLDGLFGAIRSMLAGRA